MPAEPTASSGGSGFVGGTQKQMRRTLSSLALGGDAGKFFFQILEVSVLEEEEEEEEEVVVVVVVEEEGGVRKFWHKFSKSVF